MVKGEALFNFRGHSSRVMCVVWSYLDADLVYSGGEDGTVRPWRPSLQQHRQPPVSGGSFALACIIELCSPVLVLFLSLNTTLSGEGTTTSFVIPPNSNTLSDWRRTCHVSWVKTHQLPGANKTQ